MAWSPTIVPISDLRQDAAGVIQRVGTTMILFPKRDPWASFVQSLDEFSEDFMAEGRCQPGPQQREGA